MSTPASTFELRNRALGIVATGTILAILYFGRGVLVPIALALLLSLLITPLVRALRRLGIGATAAALVAVLALVLSLGSLAAMVTVQLARMAVSLPQYEDTIHDKLATLNAITVERFNEISGQVGRLFGEREAPQPAHVPALRRAASTAPSAPIPVELHTPPVSGLQVVERVLGTVWVPIETAGIVLVVLVFVLLEHETVRDRFIRVVGGTDVRATTLALNDAGERLSRLFVSQFLVNVGVAVAIWIGLLAIGVPHALLWGALAGALRFVPYVGVWLAALFSALLAAAVEPGWSLALETLAIFVLVDLVTSQLIEPQLYGHTTGLSPLSVVIAAIFWSWLWGPIGLILSTPLTLCLVVAGRHVKALAVLDLLLGDTQALSMPQKLYQRALSGDADEIVGTARAFLKQKSLAAYCDLVLIPAMRLAMLDHDRGLISEEQQMKAREAIVNVIEAIGGEKWSRKRRRMRESVLDQPSIGKLLRQHREELSGGRSLTLERPSGSVVLCVSLGMTADDLATEMLVRVLREQKQDARHVSCEEISALPDGSAPDGVASDGVALIFLVSAFPSPRREAADTVAQTLRARWGRARLVSLFLPGAALQDGPTATLEDADKTASSFGEAVQICIDWMEECKRDE